MNYSFYPSLSLLHSQGVFQLFALLCCFRLFHFSAATFCSMRFSFAREHNEGAARCFFFLLKWSCSKHQHNVAHTHAHARERHRDVAVAAAGRRDTRQSDVLNCFCLLAANCGTVWSNTSGEWQSAVGEHRETTKTELNSDEQRSLVRGWWGSLK